MLLASFVMAQDAHLDKHDYSANCVYQGCRGCHIPHGGSITDSTYAARDTVFGTGGVNAPWTGAYKLWDKNISTSGYQTYSSDNVTGETMQLTTNQYSVHSYLCLSCHDGAMATINLPNSVSTSFDPAALLVDVSNGDFDLTNDHPVDVAWPTGTAVASGTLAGDPTVADGDVYEQPANVSGGLTTFNTTAMPLYGGSNYIECSTCHDPHEQVQNPPSGVRGNFLRLDTGDFNNYNLCRTCHASKR